MIQMEYYLVISTLMFFIGIFGFITRKNMIAILISLELVLNAVEINFAVFNRYLYPEQAIRKVMLVTGMYLRRLPISPISLL